MSVTLVPSLDGSSPAIVKISGRLDAYSAETMEKDLEGEIDRGTAGVVLDFSNCDFLSSTGLRVLFSLQNRLGGSGSLKLVGVGPQVKKIFTITDCVELFDFYGTIDEAISTEPGR
jgi:anti-sigma B factor antagonist